MENNAFLPGERLQMDVYFKWGLIMPKAGNVELLIDNAVNGTKNGNGQNAAHAIAVQRAQPVEQRLDLPHNDGQQPRGGADRDEERERGLVLFQEQGQHSRHKHRGGQLAQQHHSS
jgi:hypothetical protein